MEAVTHGLPNIIVHLNELVVHSTTQQEHLDHLQLLLQWLRHHSIKINLPKSDIGNTDLSFLGFWLPPKGIVPGEDYLKAIQQTPPPSPVQEIWQFLGMCNFFWAHIQNYAKTDATLNALI
jgi:hypothetical protein